MKKHLISLCLSLLVTVALFAAKARPGVVRLTLTDGSSVMASLVGDEHFHYYQTTDGTPLLRMADGRYQVTTRQLLQERQTARMLQRSRGLGIGKNNPSYFPHQGSPKALVILVQFQDVKFLSSDPVATFRHYLHGTIGEPVPEADGRVFRSDSYHSYYGGVRQYFSDMSDGKFTPQFDLTGPVTVSRPSSYYGANTSYTDDAHFAEMISEACQLIDDKVNFADYDADGDGYVDLVYVIYAGYAESISGNSPDCLWPKSGTGVFCRIDAEGNTTTELLLCDGKRLCRYGINNELNDTPADSKDGKCFLNGIGLFCHEFCHTMGMPDLYPVSQPAASADNQSPEFWDLMDMGEYTDNGYRPTPLSPWQRSVFGWGDPVVLTGDEPRQMILEPYCRSSLSYRIDAEQGGEYLILQNITNEGWWRGLPGYGLLVWRVDYAETTSINLFDYPNNRRGKPRVMVVPADGLLINSYNVGEGGAYTDKAYLTSLANDPFPAYGVGAEGKDVNSLTEVRLNNSTLTSRPLYHIQKNEQTGMVSFDYLKDFSPTGIMPVVTAQPQSVLYYDLTGRRVLLPRRGHLYITNQGTKVVY